MKPIELQIQNLTISYGRFPALQNLNLTIAPGSLLAVIGPNGSGKSTLLKAIMGIAPIKAGTINITSKERQRIAYLPQLSELDRHFPINVHDLVAMGLLKERGPFSKYSEHDEHIIDDALTKVSMQKFKNHALQALSGGQFQRVLFARAIVQNPDIFLLDEPFTGVDTTTTNLLMEQILSWHRDGKTVVAVIHDPPLVKAYFKEAVLLARTVVATGKVEEVMREENLLKAHTSLDYLQHHQTIDEV